GMFMHRILFVNACPRPHSRTLALARSLLERTPGTVEEVRLFDEQLSSLDWAALQARDAAVQAGDYSGDLFRFARQFAAADQIVIAAPYWDLLFPAVLRTYLEAVTVTGLTFRYTSAGIPEGLCRAKWLVYVTTAGGPVEDRNYGFAYVKALAQTFYGIPNIRCLSAEGLDIVGADANALLEQAKQRASLLAEDWTHSC
ncbi:MAG: NAD(P)H-dependent oxidoreductase, partial [Butyricicoccus sp.]